MVEADSKIAFTNEHPPQEYSSGGLCFIWDTSVASSFSVEGIGLLVHKVILRP